MLSECYATPRCSEFWNVDVYAFEIDRTSDISKTLPTMVMACQGDKNFSDAFRISDVVLNPKLIDAGFTESVLSIGSENFIYPFTEAFEKCIWPNLNCISDRDRGGNLPFALTLKRTGPGWDTTFAHGEIIATFKFQYRTAIAGRIGWWDGPYVKRYTSAGVITPKVYTCSVNNSDASIRMPLLDALDIKKGVKGKITSSKRPFNFPLTCRAGTVVYLQFDGATYEDTGSDSVLKNLFPRNDNLGIQLFNGESPLTVGDKFLITNRAENFINLAYDAYYYYKGGEVNGGPFKAQVTFTFTYE